MHYFVDNLRKENIDFLRDKWQNIIAKFTNSIIKKRGIYYDVYALL